MIDIKYCKYHNIFEHVTNNCVYFKEMIKKAIKQGCLKFANKGNKMMIDKNPFLVSSIYVKPISEFGMDINVVCYYE